MDSHQVVGLRITPTHDPAVHKAQEALPRNSKGAVSTPVNTVEVAVVKIVRQGSPAHLEQVLRVPEFDVMDKVLVGLDLPAKDVYRTLKALLRDFRIHRDDASHRRFCLSLHVNFLSRYTSSILISSVRVGQT